MRSVKLIFILTAALALLLPLAGAAQSGNLRYTVTVSQFENEAGWSGQWDIGNAWGTVLTDLLNQSGKFIVLAESDMRGAALDEQDFAASGRTAGGKKAPVTGQMTPAQILIKGAITHVQHQVQGGGGGVRIGGFRVGGKGGKSEINVTIYMVDSTTGQVLASKSVVGDAKKRGANLGYSTGDWGAAFGGNKDDNLGKAIAAAADEAVNWMTGQLGTVQWSGTVVMNQGGQIYINRGTREGVSVGDHFVVGESTVIRDPDTGEVLDELVNEIARLEVVSVKEKLAICRVVSGNGGAVTKGQTIQPG